MGSYLLVVAGVAFAALFALNNLLKTLFRRNRIGFVDILLAFLTALVPLAALILAQTREAPDSRITQASLLLGAALAIFSLILLLLELFRAQRWKGSRGILGIYTGLLLMIASITVPLSAAYVADRAGLPAAPGISTAAQQSTQVAQAESPTPTRQISSTPMPSPTLSPTPTETSTPRPTRTPSATRFTYSTRTPTFTPTPVSPCVASVEYNLRLRSAPTTESETLLVIPFGTSVELYGKGIPSGEGANWWYAAYEGQQGWLDGQFMLVGSACDNLPLRES